ncbi:MAG: hypothetical protein NTV52_04300 [Acidobacteria bacterium]|nr:hypothetical protein [Acidobacteriota bacterium]
MKYATDSPQDFEELKNQIKARAEALVNQVEATKGVAASITTDETDGLMDHEAKALAFVFALAFSTEESVPAQTVKEKMAIEGYINEIGTRIAISGLIAKGLIKQQWSFDEEPRDGYWAYFTTEAGERWMRRNQARFNLKVEPSHHKAEIRELLLAAVPPQST